MKHSLLCEAPLSPEVISPWTENKQQTDVSSGHVVDKTPDQWVSIYLQSTSKLKLGVKLRVQNVWFVYLSVAQSGAPRKAKPSSCLWG